MGSENMDIQPSSRCSVQYAHNKRKALTDALLKSRGLSDFYWSFTDFLITDINIPILPTTN